MTRRRVEPLRACAVLLAAASLLAAQPRAPQQEALRQLGGIDEIKSWFNANQGHPRVIFLLSPT